MEKNMKPISPNSTQLVCSNGASVGFLTEESARRSFMYCQSWLEQADAFPIAPCFPLTNTRYADTDEHQRVSWFFDNLLQEEDSRKSLAKLLDTHPDDSWQLLMRCGGETAGALALHPVDYVEAAASLKPLPSPELEERIRDSERTSLFSGAAKVVALAGAQAKLAAVVTADAFYEPVGQQLSTHILKPDSKARFYPHTAANEYFCMTLAAAVGIDVPATSLHRVPAAVFAVERFDRVTEKDQLSARHIIDGTQLLALSSQHKYSMMTPRMLRLCCELCTEPNKVSISIFDWAIFNVLVGNSDAHLKNLSFFVDSNGITLAPFYDLLSTAVYATPDNWPFEPHWPKVKLSMPIGQATRYADVTREDFLEFGAELEISKPLAEFRLDALIAQTRVQAPRIYEALQVTPSERRLLNAIQQLPIREMRRRLTSLSAGESPC
jgi:HipA-like protein